MESGGLAASRGALQVTVLKGPKADVEACKDHIIAEVERLAKEYAECAATSALLLLF